MAFAANRPEEFYNEARELNEKIWDGIHGLITLQAEWDAGGYGDDLPAGVGTNSGVTKAEVGPVVFDTANALKAVLNANSGAHAANMQKLL